MSTFKVEVFQVKVEPHPNTTKDRLELGRIGDYRSVIGKSIFTDGQLVAYIPEAAIIPEVLQQEMGLVGKLAGSKKDRIKAIRLGGILSQGVLYPARPHWKIGDDVAEELGITKWEPPIPTHMAGDVQRSPYGMKFDIENIKMYPDVLQEGEEIVFTEKLHGTCMLVCLVPEADRHPEMIDGKLIVISKGLAAKSLFFKDNEANNANVYVKLAKQLKLAEKLSRFAKPSESRYSPTKLWEKPIWILGEAFGMQDLKYGHTNGSSQFRVFGIKVGDTWLSYKTLEFACGPMEMNLEMVPILYQGPYSKAKIEELTTGKETLTGKQLHMREGGVITPTVERTDPKLGRVILKSVSPDYILRKGETTEYT